MRTLFFSLVLFCITKAKSQEISIFSGLFGNSYYQDDKKITKSELIPLLEKNEIAFGHWKKSRTQEIIAYTMLATEVGFGVWGISESRKTGDVPTGATIGVFGSASAAVVFALIANNSRKKAVLTYNKGIEGKNAVRFVPMSNQNGLGLALKF